MDADEADLLAVTARLRGALGDVVGKLRVSDALVLAGFDRPSFQRKRLVVRVMRDLGWEHKRQRVNGVTQHVYARGSLLERETTLEVTRGDDGIVVTKREP